MELASQFHTAKICMEVANGVVVLVSFSTGCSLSVCTNLCCGYKICSQTPNEDDTHCRNGVCFLHDIDRIIAVRCTALILNICIMIQIKSRSFENQFKKSKVNGLSHHLIFAIDREHEKCRQMNFCR